MDFRPSKLGGLDHAGDIGSLERMFKPRDFAAGTGGHFAPDPLGMR
jgi:hypothetical protein